MIAFVTDLIFSTKITSTAAAMGAAVKVVRSIDKLDARLAMGIDRLAMVDLDCDDVDVCAVIRRMKAISAPPRIIGFVSHVRTELIASARESGADDVMARSAFVNKLPALLAEGARLEKDSSPTQGSRP